MGLKLVNAAVETIISLDEAKAHLRVDHDDDDDLIGALIDAVVSYVEGPRGYLARALAEQTWDLTLDGFPDSGFRGGSYRGGHHHLHNHHMIEVPLPPLIAVEGVFYRASNGDEIEMSASAYLVDAASEPGRISLASGQCWPSVCPGLNAVRVRFRAGYLDTSSPPVFVLPGNIKVALLMFLSTLYENRSESEVGLRAQAIQLPFASAALLKNYIASRGFA